METKPTRTEIQFNLFWISENPQLFKTSYDKFFAEHPAPSWKHSSKARPGWLTLIAYCSQDESKQAPDETIKECVEIAASGLMWHEHKDFARVYTALQRIYRRLAALA